MTGFTADVRAIIIEREGGRCARCGALTLHGGQIHHRRPRGMGGSSWREATNLPANGLHLCAVCHRMIERDRETAYKLGWLVHHYELPSEVLVLYRGLWMRLDDDGSLNPAEPRIDDGH